VIVKPGIKYFDIFALKLSQMKTGSIIAFFLLFTLLIAIPPVVLQHSGNGDLLDPGFWTIFAFMSVLTFLVLMLMTVVYQKNAEYFSQAFLGGTTLKILGCLIFIFVFLANNKVNKLVFGADFFYIYLLNTGFEIYVLLRNLRHKNLR
jgi:hypothetical protein